MGQKYNAYEHGLTGNTEPIPLALPSKEEVRKTYGDDAARLFMATENYQQMRDVLERARSGTLGSIDETKDRPKPLPNDLDCAFEQPHRKLNEHLVLLNALARPSSDAGILAMQQYKERYEQEIASHEEVLVSATTTPKDLEICNRKIALRVLEIHMLHALLNGDVLAWKTIKPLIDADDRCDALSGAEMEHAFIEYMKICIQRGLIKPVSA